METHQYRAAMLGETSRGSVRLLTALLVSWLGPRRPSRKKPRRARAADGSPIRASTRLRTRSEWGWNRARVVRATCSATVAPH